MAVYAEIQAQRAEDEKHPQNLALLNARVGAVYAAADATARDEEGGEESFRQALIDLAACCEFLAVKLPPPEAWAKWLERQDGKVAEAAREIAAALPAQAVSNWTPELCIAAIRRFVEHHGRLPRTAEWAKKAADHPTPQTVRNRFGSWGAGLRAAGFDPGEQPAEQDAHPVAA